jgi:hypothetical protein
LVIIFRGVAVWMQVLGAAEGAPVEEEGSLRGAVGGGCEDTESGGASAREEGRGEGDVRGVPGRGPLQERGWWKAVLEGEGFWRGLGVGFGGHFAI